MVKIFEIHLAASLFSIIFILYGYLSTNIILNYYY